MFSCNQCGYSTDVKCNWNRHKKRATPCKPPHPLEWNIYHSDICTDVTNQPIVNVTNDEIVTIKGTVGESRYSIQEDGKWLCRVCQKLLFKHNTKRHSCRGAPALTCKLCGKVFKHRQNLCVHKKICKASTTNVRNNTNSHNTVNNHNSNNTTIVINNNYNTYNIQQTNNHVFGHEDFTDILNLLEEDPRLRDAVANLKTALSLVHFNKDFPQNQTVRKMNKRSNTIELRQSVNPERWDLEPFELGFGKVLDNLQRHLKIDIRHTLPIHIVRDQMYHMSKIQPTLSTSDIVTPNNTEPIHAGTNDMHALLHQIAHEKRDDFLSDSTRIDVERCQTFKQQLHDAFRRRGLLYEVVNIHEHQSLMHFYRFLSKRSSALEYAPTRV